VQLLVEHGAWLEAVDEEGDTPLHFAVREGHAEVVEWLLSSGADRHHLNDDEESPLFLATTFGDAKVLAAFEAHKEQSFEHIDADVGSADARDVKISSCEVKHIPNPSSSAMGVDKSSSLEWKENELFLKSSDSQLVN
jgi:ankyrin repeat protein